MAEEELLMNMKPAAGSNQNFWFRWMVSGIEKWGCEALKGFPINLFVEFIQESKA